MEGYVKISGRIAGIVCVGYANVKVKLEPEAIYEKTADGEWEKRFLQGMNTLSIPYSGPTNLSKAQLKAFDFGSDVPRNVYGIGCDIDMLFPGTEASVYVHWYRGDHSSRKVISRIIIAINSAQPVELSSFIDKYL